MVAAFSRLTAVIFASSPSDDCLIMSPHQSSLHNDQQTFEKLILTDGIAHRCSRITRMSLSHNSEVRQLS